MVREAMEFVKAYDPELGKMMQAEYDRQARNIELIASENIVCLLYTSDAADE